MQGSRGSWSSRLPGFFGLVSAVACGTAALGGSTPSGPSMDASADSAAADVVPNADGEASANGCDAGLEDRNDGLEVPARPAWDLSALVPRQVVASDGNRGDFFGDALALDGNWMVVGAPRATVPDGPFEPGAAYLFQRTTDGWQQEAKVTSAAPADHGHVGEHVALSGNTALVTLDGRVSVRIFTGGAWVEQAVLSPNADSYERVTTVALSHDVAVLGTNGPSYSECAPGRILIFRRSQTTWSLEQTLNKEHCGAAAALAVDGEDLVLADADVRKAQVRMFRGGECGWTVRATFTELTEGTDYMSVAVHDGMAVLGMPVDGATPFEAGSAVVFERVGDRWTRRAKVRAKAPIDHDYFGWSVATGGGLVAVGAPSSTLSSQYHPGKAFLYLASTGFSNATEVWRGEQDDIFGFTVAASFPRIAVGQSKGGDHAQGAVWVYEP